MFWVLILTSIVLFCMQLLFKVNPNIIATLSLPQVIGRFPELMR